MIATSTTADRHGIKMRWFMFASATASWTGLARSVLGGGSRGTGASLLGTWKNTGARLHNALVLHASSAIANREMARG